MAPEIAAARLLAAEAEMKRYLLELPRELRNHIYDFAREEETFRYHYRYEPEYCQFPKPVPQYLALTQVCQQLRAEYSPLYAARTEVHVSHYELLKFVTKQPPLVRDRNGCVNGNIVVNCMRNPNHLSSHTVHHPYNILPFLRYLKDKPCLHVRPGKHEKGNAYYQEKWGLVEEYLVTLFAVHSNIKLQGWLQDAVSEVTLDLWANLDFIIKDRKGKKWMTFMRYRNEETRDDNCHEWMKDTGLDLTKLTEPNTRTLEFFLSREEMERAALVFLINTKYKDEEALPGNPAVEQELCKSGDKRDAREEGSRKHRMSATARKSLRHMRQERTGREQWALEASDWRVARQERRARFEAIRRRHAECIASNKARRRRHADRAARE